MPLHLSQFYSNLIGLEAVNFFHVSHDSSAIFEKFLQFERRVVATFKIGCHFTHLTCRIGSELNWPFCNVI